MAIFLKLTLIDFIFTNHFDLSFLIYLFLFLIFKYLKYNFCFFCSKTKKPALESKKSTEDLHKVSSASNDDYSRHKDSLVLKDQVSSIKLVNNYFNGLINDDRG